MATKTWNGSTGAFTTDGAWSPAGTPTAGDTAVINAGTVTATGLPSGVGVVLSSSLSSSPTLDVTNTAFGASTPLTITTDRSNSTLITRGSVTNDGTITVNGTGQGGIFAGAAFIQLADVSGGGPTVFANTGTIQVTGSKLQVLANSLNLATQFRNDGVMSISNPNGGSQQAYFGVNLTGNGTYVLGNGVSFEAAGTVSAGLTFSFERGANTATSLSMFTGPDFQGTVDGFAALDTINLQSFAWDNYSYASTGVGAGVLTLSSGGQVVKTIPFRGSYTRDSFQLQQSAIAANGTSSTVVRTNVAEGGGPTIVYGTPGNDVFNDTSEDVTYVGSGGYDILVVNEGRRGATFTLQSNGDVIFTHRGQTDTLRSVEEVRFIDGREAFSPSDPAAQVQRLYQAGLGRVGEQGGLNFWIAQVQSGRPIQGLAADFLASPEFTSRFPNVAANSDFVTRIYQNVLGRDPEAGGLNFWLNLLNTGAANRAGVLSGIADSAENRAITATLVSTGIWDINETSAQVARLYDTALGRVPDASGLDFWTKSIDGGANLLNLAQAFVTSQEFQSTYGALANRQFVERVYVNTLDRPGEADGVNFWTSQLDAGVSRAQVVTGFSESPEHQALTKADILPEDVASAGIRLA